VLGLDSLCSLCVAEEAELLLMYDAKECSGEENRPLDFQAIDK